jgi:hypothetical protein
MIRSRTRVVRRHPQGGEFVGTGNDPKIDRTIGKKAAARFWKRERANQNQAGRSSSEVLERRHAQLRVARRMLDRSMAEPVLDAPRVVAGVGPAPRRERGAAYA